MANVVWKQVLLPRNVGEERNDGERGTLERDKVRRKSKVTRRGEVSKKGKAAMRHGMKERVMKNNAPGRGA